MNYPEAVARLHQTGRSNPSPRSETCRLSALQLGLGWFPESAGGVDRFYFDLVRELPKHAVECEGLVLGSENVSSQTGGRIRSAAAMDDSQFKRFAGMRRSVRAALRSGQFDLVASHFAFNTFPALGVFAGLPLVVHFHGPWALESRAEGAGRIACRLRKGIESSVYRRAARIVCLSEAFARIVREEYRIPADRIRVVPGAVDVDRFDLRETRTQARQRLGWSTERPTVLCVRRLVRRMGLENLVEAAAAVRRAVPDAQFLIAGRGPLKTVLDEQIASRGLGETVRLLGFVPDSDLAFAYRAADLSIVPSVALEGFGLVAAESLSAGTPVLVTPVGGLPEVVGSLSPNLLLEGCQPGQLAEGISRSLRQQVPLPSQQECTEYARNRFGWPRVAEQVRAVYRDALSNA